MERDGTSRKSAKKKYVPPRFADLPPEQARAMLAARDVPEGPVMKQLLKWAAELENRRSDKK
jgi:hypothetical protein